MAWGCWVLVWLPACSASVGRSRCWAGSWGPRIRIRRVRPQISEPAPVCPRNPPQESIKACLGPDWLPEAGFSRFSRHFCLVLGPTVGFWRGLEAYILSPGRDARNRTQEPRRPVTDRCRNPAARRGNRGQSRRHGLSASGCQKGRDRDNSGRQLGQWEWSPTGTEYAQAGPWLRQCSCVHKFSWDDKGLD